jgi:hypothetical protein
MDAMEIIHATGMFVRSIALQDIRDQGVVVVFLHVRI